MEGVKRWISKVWGGVILGIWKPQGVLRPRGLFQADRCGVWLRGSDGGGQTMDFKGLGRGHFMDLEAVGG